jgi:3-phosphoglycerate kinase
MILDIGRTRPSVCRALQGAGTIVWNGPSACSSSTSSAKARA